MGKTGILLERQQNYDGPTAYFAWKGPWKVLLVAAASREVPGAAALLRVTLSVLPISTQASGATNPAPHSSPHSFIALPTPSWPRTQLQTLLSQLSLPKTHEEFWSIATFGLSFRTLTDSKPRKI